MSRWVGALTVSVMINDLHASLVTVLCADAVESPDVAARGKEAVYVIKDYLDAHSEVVW